MPYEFIIDFLFPLKVCIKPMFGCYGVYRGNRLLLFLRQEAKHSELNGVYVATQPNCHEDLLKDIPSSYHEKGKNPDEKTWIFLPEYGEYFEEWVRKTCEMICMGDERIGRDEIISNW
jgi:hypothetical protein